jgi:hypothetical protein
MRAEFAREARNRRCDCDVHMHMQMRAIGIMLLKIARRDC